MPCHINQWQICLSRGMFLLFTDQMKTLFFRARALILGWRLLALPLVVYLPFLAKFPFPPGEASYSDLAITHYPNALFLQSQLLTAHRLPLWSPAILSGYPFAANPLSGIWYLPGWLAVIFPLPAGLNISLVLHLLLGGVGMAQFLSQSGLRKEVSLFGGVAFETMPKIVAHWGAGHLTLLYAVAWTPWLLWAERRSLVLGLEDSGESKGLYRLLQPGVVFAVILLADVRWSFYAGMIWVLFSVYRAFSAPKRLSLQLSLWNAVRHLSIQAILAFLLAAPLLLPLIEYSQLSTRAALTGSEQWIYSLPPQRVLGLLYPDFGGFYEWIIYPGAIVLILGILSLNSLRYVGLSRFFLGLCGLSVLMSLGKYLPQLEWVYHLPGMNLLRVPPRAMFLCGFSLCVLSALSLQEIIGMTLPQFKSGARRLIFALLAFTLALTAIASFTARKLPAEFVWGTIFVLASAGWVFIFSPRLSRRAWLVGVFALLLTDLAPINASLLRYRDAKEVFFEQSGVAAYLSGQSGSFRVYTPSYSIPQQTAARYGLQLANGLDPLQLEKYAHFMGEASGVPREGYSVSLPALDGENPKKSNIGFVPDAEKLGILNVRYVAADYDIDAEALILRAGFGETRVYENLKCRPRAWKEWGETFGWSADVEIIRWSPSEIQLTAQGPGRIVLSEIDYPGWVAKIDDQKASIEPYNNLLRSVQLPAGQHQVTFTFRPLTVYLGLAGSILALALLVGKAIFESLKSQAKPV